MEQRVRKKAKRLLSEAGKKFRKEVKEDRALAYENFRSTVMGNLDVIAAANMEKFLESVLRMITMVDTMIGAPKKRVETYEAEPLKVLRDWLNGAPENVVFGDA